ncbi:MAG: putative acyl-CoA dehydrogenase FadE [Porticoccaceae bacterium]|nr:MAG: putative acyl-CoA dehydrogenase FadE [Porticoccaceae bacterium]
MDFTFSEDECLLRDAAREFFATEMTADRLRRIWEEGGGCDDRLWSALAELGLPGILVPEEQGGLGLDEAGAVRVVEEAGYVALPESPLHAAWLAPFLLPTLGEEGRARWLPRLLSGEARIAVGIPGDLAVEDADRAHLVLLSEGDALFALTAGSFRCEPRTSFDPGRRAFAVTPSIDPVCIGAEGARIAAELLDRAAVLAAAYELGLARRILDLAVEHARQRCQFGRPVGSFQAVKHLLADVAVRLQFARPVVYRAAWVVAREAPRRALAVSHARLAAGQAARLAARNGLQVFGAMGYTWECDLQLYLKRVWSLAGRCGDEALHRRRVRQALLVGDTVPGAGDTFAEN